MNTLRSDRSDLVMMSHIPLMMTGWLLPSVTKRQRASDIDTVSPDYVVVRLQIETRRPSFAA